MQSVQPSLLLRDVLDIHGSSSMAMHLDFVSQNTVWLLAMDVLVSEQVWPYTVYMLVL